MGTIVFLLWCGQHFSYFFFRGGQHLWHRGGKGQQTQGLPRVNKSSSYATAQLLAYPCTERRNQPHLILAACHCTLYVQYRYVLNGTIIVTITHKLSATKSGMQGLWNCIHYPLSHRRRYTYIWRAYKTKQYNKGWPSGGTTRSSKWPVWHIDDGWRTFRNIKWPVWHIHDRWSTC